MLRQCSLEKSLGPACVLHAIGEAVSDDGNDVLLLKSKRRGVLVVGGDGDDLHLLAIGTAVGNFSSGSKIDIEDGIGSAVPGGFEDLFSLVIEKDKREAIEALGKTFPAIPDRDRIDGLSFLKVEFPPGLVFDPGMSLPATSVDRVFVPINCAGGIATVSRRRLLGFSSTGDVFFSRPSPRPRPE